MLRFLLTLVAALVLTAPHGDAKSMALIIGNDNYQNVTPLRKARSDAAGYHQLFATKGFDVSLHTDLSAREMTVELATFFDRIEPGDTVVFVFAGHGWSDGRENFLVPVDIRPSGSETLLSRESFALRNGANGIIDEIAKRGAGLTLAIIDACRDNPFAAQEGGTRSIGMSRGLAPIKAPTGTFVAFSAGAGQTALDRLSDADSAPYSVFTRHFLTELSKAQDLQAAFKRTQRLVNSEAGRVGHPQRPAYYDEVIGSACLFSACDGTRTATEPPAAPVARQQPATDLHAEAAQSWTAFQSSNSVDALKLFADRYAGTAYAALAEERIAALSVPAPQPAPQPAPAPQPRVYVPKPGWCPRASTATEIAICSDDTLAQLDQQINSAYAYWKSALSGAAERQFDAAQKQWLRSRDACGGDRGCIGNAYRARLSQIRF